MYITVICAVSFTLTQFLLVPYLTNRLEEDTAKTRAAMAEQRRAIAAQMHY